MIMPEKTTALAQANEKFRQGNYSEAISFYLEAARQHPELAQTISMNIAIADARLKKNVSSTSFGLTENDLDLVNEPVKTAAITVDDTVTATEKAEELAQNPEITAASSVLDMLSLKLVGPPKRLLKTYDTDLERLFTSKALEESKSISARLKKISVSIIMPTYNRASTLGKAIDSVLAQTHKKWELIIIDDGSTDGSAEILTKYSRDKKIKIIKGEHKGVSAARNKGLEKATGDYIYYLDSDNTWTSQYLYLMNLAFLKTGLLTGYAGITLVDENALVLGYRGESFAWDHCLQANYIDINTFGHHRSFLTDNGMFDTTLRRMVDWDLILRYTKTSLPFYAPFIGCIYLESRNDKGRITLSEPLAFQKVVRLKNSTTDSSPEVLARSLSLNFAIKIPAPFEEREQWGDYHYADSLRLALEEMGHKVTLDFHGAWYNRPPSADDVVIVIRGLTAYNPKKGAINIIWSISHPDQVSMDEFELYDLVYVASASYANLLKLNLNTKVAPLIQCTDPQRFFYKKPIRPRSKDMLFVGNSRNEYRPIVRKAIEGGKSLAIYGTRWKPLVDQRHVRGENVPNTELSRHYAAHEVVLNDHWESMREFGYVSNRVFDVLAAGSTLVSDSLPSITRLFGDSVVQLEDAAGLDSVIGQLQSLKERGEAEKERISNFVRINHSFKARAHVIGDDILTRLGLPTTWSDDHNRDAGNCEYEGGGVDRKKIGLLIEPDWKGLNHAAYRRLISPLTTDFAHSEFELIILGGVQDSRLQNCSSVVVQGHAITSIENAQVLIDLTAASSISLYLDVYKPQTTTARGLANDSEAQAFDLVMYNATHVWFSNARLALSYCHAYAKGSVVPDTIDPRFWRNYRKPIPRPALAPKFRILYLPNSNDTSGMNILIPALDAVYASRGKVFELVIIGEIAALPARPWLKVIRPTSQRSEYPQFANWLANAEKFDFGVAPISSDSLHVASSDSNFLHYSALGLPTLSSRSVPFSEVQELGLVLATENHTEHWVRSLTMAMDNRELMLNMAHRAWEYIWKLRSPQSTLMNVLPLLQAEHKPSGPRERVEGSISQQVAVCIHLYYIDQWPTIQSRLNNIERAFDLFVTCTEEDLPAVIALISTEYPNARILGMQNHGMDVLPFLQINHDFSLWNYVSVLKLHTKNTKTNDDAIFGNMCLESLLPNPSAVEHIVDAFADDHKIGLIGPEFLYRSAESLMYVNAAGVRDILNSLDFNYPKSDWGFFAGTMFWIRGSLLHSLAANFETIRDLALRDFAAAKSGGDGSWAHAMERVFGALPMQQGMNSAAMYLDSPTKASWNLRAISEGEFHKSLSYRVSSKWHVARYSNLAKWAALCMGSELFNEDYYVENSGGIIPVHMSPITHFILYGDDLALNPSAGFSTAYYKRNNIDVVHARVPTLVHYLVHGMREGRMIVAVSEE